MILRLCSACTACPAAFWAEVKREGNPNSRTLAKAQVALAVSILCYMPLRLQNTPSLTFGTHLFLREEPRAILDLGTVRK